MYGGVIFLDWSGLVWSGLMTYITSLQLDVCMVCVYMVMVMCVWWCWCMYGWGDGGENCMKCAMHGGDGDGDIHCVNCSLLFTNSQGRRPNED